VGTSGIVGAEVPGGPAASGAAIALIDEHGATRITLRSTNGDALVTFAAQDALKVVAGLISAASRVALPLVETSIA
jgi:hypothetical protein